MDFAVLMCRHVGGTGMMTAEARRLEAPYPETGVAFLTCHIF